MLCLPFVFPSYSMNFPSWIRANLYLCISLSTYVYINLMVSCVNHCPYSVSFSLSLSSSSFFRFFFFFFFYFCIEKNLSRKQTSPLVDGSSTIVCSRVFIFMCRTLLNGKFERERERSKKKKEEKERKKYDATGGERANERTGRWRQQRVFRYSFYVRV